MSNTCNFCGKEAKEGWVFCSMGCRNKANGLKKRLTKDVFACLQCGKEYGRLPSQIAKGNVKFCSRTCYNVYQKEHGKPNKKVVALVCKHCGKDFVIPQCWLNKGRSTGQYCSRECWHEVQRARGGAFGGSKKAEWGNGIGIFTDPQGYIHEYDPNRHKFIRQHRLVMEKMLGRPLEKGESVHHKNGKRDDNRPKNLELIVGSHFTGKRVKDLVGEHVQDQDGKGEGKYLLAEIKRLAAEVKKMQQEIQELRNKEK